MARVISLFLPTYATDRVRRLLGAEAPPADTPLVLVGRDVRRHVVFAADKAALDAGVRPGMAATKAQTLIPGLVVRDTTPDADAEGLVRLALWTLQRYAPIVAADLPDGIVIDSTGADHLHGGEAAMISSLLGRLGSAGLAARVAVADTWGAAHAIARYRAAPSFVSAPGAAGDDIAALPIAALRLSNELIDGLRVLGFDRIRDLLGKPRAPLALRFGPELGRRIDQALGRLAEPIDPIRPAELIEVRRIFAEPIAAAETIARYIGKLVTEICGRLEAKALGARRLDLICHRVDSRAQAIRVGTAKPVRDVKRLTRLLTDQIENIERGFGIEIMSLAATVSDPLPARQIVSDLVHESEPDVSALIDLLVNRVGEERIFRAAPLDSDIPERSIRRIPALAPPTGAGWPTEWPRPARLLSPPEPIETVALMPDHPPASFTWRGIRRRVRRADGPERVFGEWWRADPELAAVRDYFRVEDDAGERYWVYRSGDGEDADTGSNRWYLHGIFA